MKEATICTEKVICNIIMNITIEGKEHEQFREDIANLIMDALKENVDV